MSLIVFIGIYLLTLFIKDEFAGEMFLVMSFLGLMNIWFGDAMSRMSKKHIWIWTPMSGRSARFLGWLALFITFVAIIILKLA
jgi:hypothetical protein